MTTVLALDVSARATGWAYGAADETPTSGVVRFSTPGGTEDEAWAEALKWAHMQIGVLNPDVVAIEAAIMSSAPGMGGVTNPATQGMLWGLQAVIRTVVKLRTPGRALLVNASAARKLFTGKGMYPKGEAKLAVQAECVRRGWLNIDTMDPDRADACCVWCFAAAPYAPGLSFSPPSKSKSRREPERV